LNAKSGIVAAVMPPLGFAFETDRKIKISRDLGLNPWSKANRDAFHPFQPLDDCPSLPPQRLPYPAS